MNTALTEAIQQHLPAALASAGHVPQAYRGAWLVAGPGGQASVEATVGDQRQHQGVCAVELCVDVLPQMEGELHSVRQLLVGRGETVADAIAQGLQEWADGVMPAVNRALLQADAAPDALWTPKQGHALWRVYLGPMQVAGTDSTTVQGWDPDTPFPALAPVLASRLSAQRRFHALKVFVAYAQGAELGVECRVDHDRFEQGEERLRAERWPTAEPYFAFRRFMVMRPVPG